jgi:hypothetical protein
MKSAVLLFVDFLVLIANALRPGGIKSLIAENLILKHQLTVLSRTRQRAPNLKATDRFLLGALSLPVSPNTTSPGRATHKVTHGYRYLVTAKTAFGALICFAVNP